MRRVERWTTVALRLGVLVLAARANAFSSGISSTSFGAQGCNECHGGGNTPVVTLTGATAVTAGSTNQYTLQIEVTGAQNKGGLNVAATGGALAVGGDASGGTQPVSGKNGRTEITHTGAHSSVDGLVAFSFLWTAPSDTTTVTMNAWGNAVNGSGTSAGDKANSAQLDISVDTATPNPTPTRTRTTTPTLTDTPPPTPTPTAVPLACVGDCNDTGTVTIEELIKLVTIALGTVNVTACTAGDANGDGDITINEIITAVNGALDGCPMPLDPEAASPG
jgi:hypothetical protein